MGDEPKPHVTITLRTSHWATMEPVVPEVRARLGRPTWEFAAGGSLGREARPVRDVTLTDVLTRREIDGDRVVVPVEYQMMPQGLVPVVASWLTDMRYPHTIEDERTDSGRWLRDQSDAYLPKPRRAVVRAVAENRAVRVVGLRVEEIVRAVVDVAAAYPQARIAVAVTSKGMLNRVRWKLKTALPEPLGVYTARHHQPQRVAVGLIMQFPRGEIGAWDLLVLPFADRAVGDNALRVATSAAFRRILAFTPGRAVPDANVAWRMHVVAGAVWPPDRPKPPVTAVVLDAHGTRPADPGTAYQEKVALYWDNPRRNRRVAQVAKWLATGKAGTIRALGGDADLTTTMTEAAGAGVNILVESLRHARALAALLPGWAVWSADDLFAVPRPAPGCGLILTELGAAERVMSNGVLVRGTGTRWPLDGLDWPRADAEYGHAVLIDFTDGYHPAAARHAIARMESYVAAGMTVMAKNAAAGETDVPETTRGARTRPRVSRSLS